MSTTVDERIVSMQFDNRHFEKNVATTMSTLDKLKAKLNFTGMAKGLEELDTTSKKVDMSAIGAGIETVKAKFSALQIIGITALQNITNTAINAGKRIVSSLTIDPVKTGLAEYETQLNAIQTILANTESKGSTLEDVNKALDELNAYADKTIYNFTEMTRNIGTFTAAGVDLDTSVSAIKGIANLAAVSGSTSQQASTAMYQLSQALSSGTVRLMDWNSVVNAGMGGQVFQDALKETARVHGIAIDDIIEKQGSFRESLSENWLSAEILTETLSKFTGDLTSDQLKSMGYTDQQVEKILKLGQTANDAATKVKTFTQLLDTLKEGAQSGWAQTWEIIIGDFEEARAMWTNVSNVLGEIISKSAESRNALLGETLGSGWGQLMDAGIMDETGYSHFMKTIAKEHGVAIDEMIESEGSLEKALRKGLGSGEITSDMFKEALSRLTKEYEGFSDEQLTNLGYTKEQVAALSELNEKVQNGSISIEDFTKKIERLSGRELLIKSFSNIFKGIVSVVKPIKEAFREIFPKTTADQLYKIIESFKKFTDKLILSEESSEKLKQTFKGLFSVLDVALTIIKKVVSSAVKLLGNFKGLGSGVLTVTSSFGNLLLRFRDFLEESNVLTKAADVITKAIQNIIDTVKDLFGILKDKLSISGFDTFVSVLKGAWSLIKSIFSKIGELMGNTFNGEGNLFGIILDVLNAGLLTTLIVKLKGLLSSVEEFSSGFGDIIGSLTGPLQALQDKLKATALKNIAIAIGILAGSLLVLSLIDEDKLDSALAAITMSLGVLMGSLVLVGKIGTAGVKNIGNMIGIASALLILSFALARLGSMEWNEIGKSLVVMTGALTIFMGALFVMSKISKDGMANYGSKQLTSMAFGLLVLSFALKRLGDMEWGEILRGLTAMTGALTVFVGVLFIMSKINKEGIATKGAGQILVMSMALTILAGSLKIIATMSWDEIDRGLYAMAGSLMIFTATLTLMSKISKTGKGAGSVLVMSMSLILLGSSLKILATMDWDDIKRSLSAMTGALAALSASLILISNFSKGGTSVLASAAAMVILASAIAILVPTLIILGNVKTGTIIKSLVTLAATLAIVGAAGILLKSAVPAILSFAASLALVGASCLAIGVGVGLMSAGLAALFTAMTAGGAAMIAVMLNLVKGLIELIPFTMQKLAEAIVLFCGVIRDGAPVIGEALVAVLLAAIEACTKVIPTLADGIFKIILGIFQAANQYLPAIVEVLVDLLVGLIKSIGTFIPDLVQAAVELFMQFFAGIVTALKSLDKDVLVDALTGIGLISGLMVALSLLTGLIPGAMLGILGMGAVVTELAIVLAAIGALSKIPGLTAIIADGGRLLQTIGTAIGQFIGGIIGGIAQGVTSSLPAIGSDLSKFMTNLQPFVNGLQMINNQTLSNAKTLASLILVVTAASIVDSLTSWLTGGVSMAQFGNEIAEFGKGVKKFADETSGIDAKTVQAAAEAGKNLGEMAKNIPTSGGLWDLIAGKNDLSDFGDQLKGFGKGIKSFASEVAGIDGASVKESAEAGVTLAKMAKNIPTSGGLWELIAGKKSMSDFASQLKTYGNSVKLFANETKSVSMEDIDKGVSAANKLSNMASSLPTSGGLWNLIKGKTDMSKFGNQLKIFGQSIKGFAAEVANIGDIGAAIANINKLSTVLGTFSSASVASITKSVEESKHKFANAIAEMFQNAINMTKSRIIMFVQVGKTFMTTFINSVKSYKLQVRNTFMELVISAISAIKNENFYNKFYSTGKYFVQGFASGISDNTYLAAAKATAMANAAKTAAQNALDEHSPSKEGYKIGDFFGVAFVNALDDYADKAYNSGYEMASSAKTGLQKAISKISSLIENGFDDSQPTLRPVLDLSDVSSGMSTINRMFGMSPSIGVLSKVDSINSMINKNQNGSNDNVIKAIEDLKHTFENASFGGDNISINGITYDDGSRLQAAIEEIIRAATMERRK